MTDKKEGKGQKMENGNGAERAEGGRSSSQLELMWRQFKRNRLARLGMLIVGLFLLFAFLAPFFSPYDYKKQNLQTTFVPPQKLHFFDEEGNFHPIPFTYKLKKTMDPTTYELIYRENRSQRYHLKFFVRSWKYKLFGLLQSDLHLFGIEGNGSVYLLGTDGQGRDLLSRIIQGGRISLLVAIVGAVMSAVIGSLIGGVSGYYAGILDILLQRIVEVVQSFPKIAMWMALSTAIPPQWPPMYVLYGIIAIFALLYWPMLAREVRGKVLSYREESFVMAAKSIGAGDLRIIVRHVLPQALSHIIVVVTVTIPWFILAESMLSFLGLGIQPPMVSWGVLLQKAQNLQTLGQHPWIMAPGVFIIFSVLGFNFLGDGLRDAADPFSE